MEIRDAYMSSHVHRIILGPALTVASLLCESELAAVL